MDSHAKDENINNTMSSEEDFLIKKYPRHLYIPREERQLSTQFVRWEFNQFQGGKTILSVAISCFEVFCNQQQSVVVTINVAPFYSIFKSHSVCSS